ncbi:ATP-dependent DNA ligase [Vagococcus fluvialis]|uniref:ATP-dependent DNA ligase n=1 Tax=Vagococcus fluvialis TaxID=2738 RepID=UPI001D0BD4C2|nr:hypothetical protein [Vagococcus fluvialis]UDM72686.1 hypothetical protein K5L00_14970 [Vagococcus fluvialis]UDM78409.1 hypothetical protein K5K98_14305 [Vagococcus fluvialis]UDM83961.1 hypothetical protein K5K96_14995 [Vagococcus fluvialis]
MKEPKLNPVELIKVERVFFRLETLSNISGKNDKKEMIAAQWSEGDETYNNVLKFLLDTMIVTNLADKKVKKIVDVNINNYPETLEDLLVFLQAGLASTDEGIAKVQAYMKTVESQKDNLIKLVTKKYKIGATAKSLNEAVGETVIDIFSCQLAQSYEKVIERHHKAADKAGHELKVAATLKLDGFRCIAIAEVENGRTVVNFYSRAGKAMEGLDHIAESIIRIMDTNTLQSFVFDGELLDGSGTWAATATTASSKGNDKSNLNFHVFDGLPLDQFWNGESGLVYLDRRDWLSQIFREVPESEPVKLLPVLMIDTPDKIIRELMPKVRANGEEGLMFNILDSQYVTKRTNNLMKVKEFLSDDLLVKSVFEGDGNFKGMLGGVYVDYKGNDVKVGSGFNEEERVKYWNNPESIIGKIIEVQYFEETSNQKNDNKSLRFPTFKGLRTDKSAEDVSYES